MLTHTRSASAFVNVDPFIGTRKSIAERQRMHDWTIDDTLVLLVSRASLQNSEFQLACKTALLSPTRRSDTPLASPTAEFQYGAVPIWPHYLQKLSIRLL